MKIEEIKQILSNKLDSLKSFKAQAFTVGDLDKYMSYDNEIAETEATLEKLNG